MARAVTNCLSPVFFPITSTRYLFKPYRIPFCKRTLAAKLRASSSSSSSSSPRAASTAYIDTEPADPVVVEKEVSTSINILGCPICYKLLSLRGDGILSKDSTPRSSLLCDGCKKSYPGKETHFELIATSGAKDYGEPMSAATEFFRIPLISFLYERGWRQNFIWGGFPGLEKEFELMKDYLKQVAGGNIVDASCGSGLFSRLFAKSGLFSLVVALDYSESMLKQCHEFVSQEESFPTENLILVRADVSRLPFVSGSVDAVHAGAAIHCWPSQSAAVAEVSRVLRPGGVFVATTFILDGPFRYVPFLNLLRQNLAQISGNSFFLSERELEGLCTACGLVGFKCIRNGQFVMISAAKPHSS